MCVKGKASQVAKAHSAQFSEVQPGSVQFSSLGSMQFLFLARGTGTQVTIAILFICSSTIVKQRQGELRLIRILIQPELLEFRQLDSQVGCSSSVMLVLTKMVMDRFYRLSESLKSATRVMLNQTDLWLLKLKLIMTNSQVRARRGEARQGKARQAVGSVQLSSAQHSSVNLAFTRCAGRVLN